MIISEVGRTTAGSSSSLPPPWVTTASSGAKPSTWSASRVRYDCGISSGKYAFWVPVSLMRASISACIRSHSPYPYGRITIVPRTGPLSASSALATTSWYQRGKSSARGVRTGALAIGGEATGGGGGAVAGDGAAVTGRRPAPAGRRAAELVGRGVGLGAPVLVHCAVRARRRHG